jgi:hypothetical protein
MADTQPLSCRIKVASNLGLLFLQPPQLNTHQQFFDQALRVPRYPLLDSEKHMHDRRNTTAAASAVV